MVGVYENGVLLHACKSEDKTSEALPKIVDGLLKRFTCKGLYFVKGPGSFMAIKVSYIFLRTLSISLNIPLLACDGFMVNGNLPIRAHGQMYFIKNGKNVEIVRLKDVKENAFLPERIDDIAFSDDIEPLYILPAI